MSRVVNCSVKSCYTTTILLRPQLTAVPFQWIVFGAYLEKRQDHNSSVSISKIFQSFSLNVFCIERVARTSS